MTQINDQSIREFVTEMVRFLQPRNSVGFVMIGRNPDGIYCHFTYEIGVDELLRGPEVAGEIMHNTLDNMIDEMRQGPRPSGIIMGH